MSILSRFEFRPILTAIMIASLVILICLGNWQMARLEWKNDLIAKADATIGAEPILFADALDRQEAGEDMTYTPVLITGEFDHENEIHVFGTLDAKPGYYVFTPLILAEETSVVFVNRGFSPLAFKRAEHRADGLIEGVVTVTGLFRMPEEAKGVAAMVKPVDTIAANEWHQRNPKAFAEAIGLAAAVPYIDSNGVENLGAWPKGGTTRLDFRNKHMEYALTWYGLAATLLVVWGIFSLRRNRDIHKNGRASG